MLFILAYASPSFEVQSLARNQESDDQTEQAENGTEDLDDENLDKPAK
jgi:hypothetical protein